MNEKTKVNPDDPGAANELFAIEADLNAKEARKMKRAFAWLTVGSFLFPPTAPATPLMAVGTFVYAAHEIMNKEFAKGQRSIARKKRQAMFRR